MSDRVVTSRLARGLVDASFARRLLGVKRSGDIDASRLALFAGLITKVRHGELAECMPATLALLRLHGAELAAFRDHFLVTGRVRQERAEKIESAMQHFAWFAATARGRRIHGLAAVIAHERALWDLARQLESTARASQHSACRLECVRLVRVTWDPWLVIEATQRGVSAPRSARTPGWRLYLADRTSRETRSMRVDALSAAVLSAVDGRTSMPHICAAVAARRRVSLEAVIRAAVRLQNLGALSSDGKAVA